MERAFDAKAQRRRERGFDQEDRKTGRQEGRKAGIQESSLNS
jgi:hypothetical protein